PQQLDFWLNRLTGHGGHGTPHQKLMIVLTSSSAVTKDLMSGLLLMCADFVLFWDQMKFSSFAFKFSSLYGEMPQGFMAETNVDHMMIHNIFKYIIKTTTGGFRIDDQHNYLD
ncbi:hypothetical protein ACJX0J_035064, partial [Zea mays]